MLGIPTRAIVLTLLFFVSSAFAGEEESAVVEWVKSEAIPLKTAEAGNGFEDMQPIKALVGSARIVSLGESTHGTREIFQMKHRMLEFLVREMNFNLFGIEASMPDCAAINEFVLHGRGDPEKAVAGQGFWTWSTEEVLDMVKWMRAYNADPANKDKPKLKFYGFDMQHTPSAVNGAIKYLERVDPDAASKLRPRVQPILTNRPMDGVYKPEDAKALRATMEELGQHLDQNREQFIEKTSKDDFALSRRYAVVAMQALEMFDTMREQSSSIGRTAEMQLFSSIGSDAKDLLGYLKQNNAELAKKSRELLEGIADFQKFWMTYNAPSTTDEQRGAWRKQADEIVSTMKSANADPKAQKQAENVATLLKVFDEYRAKPTRDSVENVRDRCMAENIAWILEHEGPDAKIVCWSHNGHANMPDPKPGQGVLAMGSYLEKQFADDHVVIGFAFNRGSFQAVPGPGTGKMGLQPWTVGPAKAGSIDATFAAAKVPIFILDLRAEAPREVREWLEAPRPLRMIGALFDPAGEQMNFYAPTALSKLYDAMIFIDTTTSARPLKAMPHASMDPMSVAMAQRPKLGVRLRQPDDGKRGVIIEEVLPGNTAEAAGLKAGDRLLKIGDHAIDAVGGVRIAMQDLEAGDVVKITIEREGQAQVIEAKLVSPDK